MAQIKINDNNGHKSETKIEAPTLEGAFILLVEKGILDLNRIQKLIAANKSKTSI